MDRPQELSEEIEDYTRRFNTEDQLEWSLVLQEVAAFVEVTTPTWAGPRPGGGVNTGRLPVARPTRWWL